MGPMTSVQTLYREAMGTLLTFPLCVTHQMDTAAISNNFHFINLIFHVC